MKLEVPVTASIASFFDCKLNPKRSHRLVTRYCSTHGYCEMAMDVISIIILFFNQCLYWKTYQLQLLKQESHKDFIISTRKIHYLIDQYTNHSERQMPIASYIIQYYDSRRAELGWAGSPGRYTYIFNTLGEHEDIMESYSSDGYAVNTNPMIDIFDMFFRVRNKSHDIYLELNDLSGVKWMTIRIRMFCVETEQEIVKVLVVAPYEEYKICNYEAIGALNSNLNIGAQVEIVHILYQNNDYWSQCPYSWFSHVVDLRLSGQCINYHNARCFRINDQHYYLMDTANCSELFYEFVDFYANEFSTLPYDIVLLENDDGSQSQSRLSDYLKTNKFRNHLKPSQQYRREDILKVMARDLDLLKVSSQCKSSFKYKKRQGKKVYHDRSKKPPKYNRSKKQKYKYHRW
eukprot:762804_1